MSAPPSIFRHPGDRAVHAAEFAPVPDHAVRSVETMLLTIYMQLSGGDQSLDVQAAGVAWIANAYLAREAATTRRPRSWRDWLRVTPADVGETRIRRSAEKIRDALTRRRYDHCRVTILAGLRQTEFAAYL